MRCGALLTLGWLSCLACGSDAGGGGVSCLAGSRVCEGTQVLVCAMDGSAFVVEKDCAPNLHCEGGGCIPGFLEPGGGVPDVTSGSKDTGLPRDFDSRAPRDAGDSAEELDAEPFDASVAEDGSPDGAWWPDDAWSDATEPPDASPPVDASEDIGEGGETSGDSATGDAGPVDSALSDAGDAAADTGAPDSGGADAFPADGDLPDVDSTHCGNGILEPGEVCDPILEVTVTCADLGFGSIGKPTCTQDCAWSGATCSGPLPFTYERIINTKFIGGLIQVRWHPSGEFALILGPTKLIRYDESTQALTEVATFYGATAMDVAPDGAFYLIAGLAKSGATAGTLWRVTVSDTLDLAVTVEPALPAGTPTAILATPYDGLWVIGSQAATNYINNLFLWKDGQGVIKNKGYNNPGIRDVMIGQPAIYGGAWTLFTVDGKNGAGSKAYLIDSDTVVDNGWKASFGNPGDAEWRPGGSYGMAAGWTTNKLYVYDGTWATATLPGLPTGASPYALRWKRDGSRALIVGAAVGSPLFATVVDHRPSGAAHLASEYYDVSITGYDQPPYFGSSYANLQAVDWRPGCDDGLIVGEDAGTAFSPTFATILRFWSAANPCAP